jgi:hypothetical protein
MKLKIAYMGAIAAALVAFAAGGIAQASPVGAHAASHHHKKHHKKKHHHSSIPQHNGGDHDADNNGGPSDGDGNI